MKIRMSSWAILNPLIVILAMIALIIGGIYSFYLLPVNGMPTVRIPVISVSIPMPGASSSDIENQITIPVENAVANISNIKHVTSYVENGLSITQIEFRYGTKIRIALSAVKDKVTSIRNQLPKGFGEPVIQQSEDDNTPLMTYVFQSVSTSLPLLTQDIDKELISNLMAIDGVEKVERQGGYDREIHVELIPEKLVSAGISALTVNKQLLSSISQAPAGKLNLGRQETYLRIQGAPSSADDLAKTQIFVGNGHYVQLSSIGLVRDTFKAAQQLTRLDRQPAIGVAIYRNAKGNELKIAAAVNKTIKNWQITHKSVVAECVQTQIDFTKKTYSSATMSFLEGILLAGLVVFVFLKSFRATLIAAIAIPLSVIPTFIVMHWLGFSLNLVSMLALSLVSGILVDDAIVEIENILRHTAAGKTPYQASMYAADEIGLAVIATSLVIIAVFAPVSFMGGVVGQYFIQFGITVATATFFSLLVARLITPVMAAYFLKPVKITEHKLFWDPLYTALLKKSIAHRPFSLILIGFVLLFSIGLLFWLPADFIPQEDKSYFMLQADLPSDARLKDTDLSVQNVSNWIMQQPEVSHVYSWIGGRDNETTVSGQVNHATLIVKLVPRGERTISVEQFKTKALYHLQSIPNIRVSTLNENGTKAFGLVLRSSDPQLLYRTSLKLENEMRSLPMLSNVLSTVPSIKNNLIITPKTHEAAKLGLSTESLADELRMALNDAQDEQLAHIYLANQFVPVKSFIRIPEQSTIAFLKQLPLSTNDQSIIPLASVVDLALKPDYSNFTRYDRMRQVMVSADINGVSLGEAMKQVTALHTLKKLPADITLGETGDSEMLSEMLSDFSVAIISGLLVVLIVLILLFRTLLQPLTIMTALPLSISGALIALIMTNQAISLPSVIGILMLMGIVGKNGILIVDFIIEKRKEGMSREEAIIAACRQRSRPIIMTSIAMIAGMIPVILGAGAGTGFRTPMAYAVIGGLITSTLLSLIVVPLIYTVIDDLEQSIKKRFSSLANSY